METDIEADMPENEKNNRIIAQLINKKDGDGVRMVDKINT